MRIAFKIMYILYGCGPASLPRLGRFGLGQPEGGYAGGWPPTLPPITVEGGNQGLGRLWEGSVDGWLAPFPIGPVGQPQYVSQRPVVPVVPVTQHIYMVCTFVYEYIDLSLDSCYLRGNLQDNNLYLQNSTFQVIQTLKTSGLLPLFHNE